MATELTPTVTRLIFSLLFYFVATIGADRCPYYDTFSNTYTEQNCVYGCCRNGCCPTPSTSTFFIGPIIGSLVSLGVLIFIIIVSICICRRRRQPGVVIHSTGASPGVVFQQSTVSTQGGVNTTGLPPGIAYPPPYGAYPYQPDTNFQGPPAYVHQAPPSYNSLTPPAYAEKTDNVYQNEDGVVNTAFKS